MGIEGIVLQETENTFKLLQRNNTLKSLILYINILTHNAVIPKGGSVFGCTLSLSKKKHVKISIYGDNFRFRSFERSSRKFKRKDNIDV